MKDKRKLIKQQIEAAQRKQANLVMIWIAGILLLLALIYMIYSVYTVA